MQIGLGLWLGTRQVGDGSSLNLNFLSGSLDSRITFTRTTTATVVGSNGLIQNTPASVNLLTWTQDFDNAAWGKVNATVTANSTAAPDGTPTADTLTATGTSNPAAFRNFSSAATAYTFSTYIKQGNTAFSEIELIDQGTSTNRVRLTYATGVLSVVAGSPTGTATNVGNGWWRVTITYTFPAIGAADTLVVYPSTTTGVIGDFCYIWGAQLETGSTATTYTRNVGGLFPARFDYDPVTLAPRGILIEEQRTNLLTNSEFPNGVSDAPTRGGNVSATTFSLLFGNTGLAINNTGPVTSFAYKTNFTTVVSTTYTLSAFVRMNDGNAPSFVSAVTTDSANSFVLVIAGSAVIPTTYTVTAMGNGFYRVSATATAGSASVNNGIVKYDTNDSRPFTVSGYQLEAGAFATSYIPTVASQVTRTADVATITGANFSQWYNQSEGTFVVEGVTQKPSSLAATVIAIDASDGSINNRHYIGVVSASAEARTVNSGSVQSTLNQAYSANSVEKYAYAVKVNDFAFARNGSIVGTDTSGAMPTIDHMFIGNAAGSAAFFNGHIRSIRYYPTRLLDTQLQALTA